MGATAAGVDTVVSAADAVVRVLQDPATAEAGTSLIAASARPLVPTASGRLRASETVSARGSGAQLTYTARYSVIVQARQPWLGEAITNAVPRLVDLYETQVLDAWT